MTCKIVDLVQRTGIQFYVKIQTSLILKKKPVADIQDFVVQGTPLLCSPSCPLSDRNQLIASAPNTYGKGL